MSNNLVPDSRLSRMMAPISMVFWHAALPICPNPKVRIVYLFVWIIWCKNNCFRRSSPCPLALRAIQCKKFRTCGNFRFLIYWSSIDQNICTEVRHQPFSALVKNRPPDPSRPQIVFVPVFSICRIPKEPQSSTTCIRSCIYQKLKCTSLHPMECVLAVPINSQLPQLYISQKHCQNLPCTR